MTHPRAEAVVDASAIAANVATLAGHAAGADVMAVVKADGYGHGLLTAGRAAAAGGASWLGVAVLEEALALRAAGVDLPVLAWLITPGEDLDGPLAADVDVSIGAGWLLEAVLASARRTGRTARIHLKIDTGLSRGGATAADWVDLVAAVAVAQAQGAVEVRGIWSHLAYADEPGHPTIQRQVDRFDEALAVAARAGVRPQLRHLANSAATLTLPRARYDLVRPGLAVYGLSPVPDAASPAALGLRPAMTLRAGVALVKQVPEGAGVSYGHRYVTTRPTTLALVPLGYADGLPRSASNAGPMLVAGRRHAVAGTVCMDQVVVDMGDDPVRAGDAVVVFGPGDAGEPTAQDWARAAGTISYEIITGVGSRVPRRVVGAATAATAVTPTAATPATAAVAEPGRRP